MAPLGRGSPAARPAGQEHSLDCGHFGPSTLQRTSLAGRRVLTTRGGEQDCRGTWLCPTPDHVALAHLDSSTCPSPNPESCLPPRFPFPSDQPCDHQALSVMQPNPNPVVVIVAVQRPCGLQALELWARCGLALAKAPFIDCQNQLKAMSMEAATRAGCGLALIHIQDASAACGPGTPAVWREACGFSPRRPWEVAGSPSWT